MNKSIILYYLCWGSLLTLSQLGCGQGDFSSSEQGPTSSGYTGPPEHDPGRSPSPSTSGGGGGGGGGQPLPGATEKKIAEEDFVRYFINSLPSWFKNKDAANPKVWAAYIKQATSARLKEEALKNSADLNLMPKAFSELERLIPKADNNFCSCNTPIFSLNKFLEHGMYKKAGQAQAFKSTKISDYDTYKKLDKIPDKLNRGVKLFKTHLARERIAAMKDLRNELVDKIDAHLNELGLQKGDLSKIIREDTTIEKKIERFEKQKKELAAVFKSIIDRLEGMENQPILRQHMKGSQPTVPPLLLAVHEVLHKYHKQYPISALLAYKQLENWYRRDSHVVQSYSTRLPFIEETITTYYEKMQK